MSAIISACGTYRYLLTREFGSSPRIATFIMLNPSTADATVDDQTIRKCIGFSKKWGCGGFRVINLFAVRARDPAEMKKHPAPQGPDNKKHFDEAIRTAKACPHQGPIVCAWGTRHRVRPASRCWSNAPSRVSILSYDFQHGPVAGAERYRNGVIRQPLKYLPSS